MNIIFGPSAGKYQDASGDIRAAIEGIIFSAEFGGSLLFGEVRDSAGKTATEWPDGYIHQAALDMGLTVQTDDL